MVEKTMSTDQALLTYTISVAYFSSPLLSPTSHNWLIPSKYLKNHPSEQLVLLLPSDIQQTLYIFLTSSSPFPPPSLPTSQAAYPLEEVMPSSFPF